MNDSTSERRFQIELPDGDVFPCPCCGEKLPNLVLLEHVKFDEEEWCKRTARIEQVIAELYPEYTEAQRAMYATAIVSINFYRENLPATIKAAIKAEQIPLPFPYVYFIQAESGGPIKIGMSANPEKRMRDLETYEPLKILATMSGGHDLEREMHKKFAHLRKQGEWFEPAPELMEYIEYVRSDRS